jgi:hypothetical protein
VVAAVDSRRVLGQARRWAGGEAGKADLIWAMLLARRVMKTRPADTAEASTTVLEAQLLQPSRQQHKGGARLRHGGGAPFVPTVSYGANLQAEASTLRTSSDRPRCRRTDAGKHVLSQSW